MKMLALFRNELWQRRWSLMWWSIAIAAYIVINLAFYSSFRDQSAQLNQTLSNIPPTVKALVTDTSDFLSPVGYLSSKIYYLLLPLLLSIFAINVGASLIAREERDGTLEMILARPISRTKLFISKIAAGLTGMLLLTIVSLTVVLVTIPLVHMEISRKAVLLTTLSAVLLGTLFGAIAFTLSAMGKTARLASAGIAALIGLGSYILTSFSETVHWLQWPAKVLPYHYYRPAEILQGNTSGKWQMLGFVVAMLVLAVVAWISFRRRDIG